MEIDEMMAQLATHENRIRVSEHRIADLEEFQRKQNDLIISVNRLADNMERMLEEQKAQGLRLQKLEQAPMEQWTTTRRIFVTALMGVIAAGIMGGVTWLVKFIIMSM